MKFNRQARYYYLRFIRLRGEPGELALGIALGVFCGMLPVIPFQTALAVMLAILFKASKITAVLGTWVSNPLNWYFLYSYSYKLGVTLMGLPERPKAFAALIGAIREGEGFIAAAGLALEAGSAFVGAFLLGGFVLGLLFAPPAYALFLPLFRYGKAWREARKMRKRP